MSRTAEVDLIIVGAGIVGATLACALADGPLRVVVLEGGALADAPQGEPELRVSALTQASQRVFERLGVWAAVNPARYLGFEAMRVWDAAGPGEIGFDAADLGLAELGWIVENRNLQSALLERLRDAHAVLLRHPARLAAVEPDAERLRVTLEDGSALTTRLLVGADGAGSRVRSLAGIGVSGWDYGQQAVVATVRTERPHAATAWQRFMPDGPLALLPLWDGQVSIVWSTTPAAAARLLAADSTAFCAALTEASGGRLGRVQAVGERAGFPLRLQHAQRYVGSRVALIGDAAHVVHPLAGQGANLGILDAAALAEVLSAPGIQDCGASALLARYQRWRKGETLLMLALMDAFKRGFGSASPGLALARGVGMRLLDNAGPLKRMVMRRAAGLDGDLPRLARAGGAG